MKENMNKINDVKKAMVVVFMLLWAGIASSMAQECRKQPLNFVSADSVLSWGGDRTDLKSTALAVDSTLKERPVVVEKKDRKRFQMDEQQWRTLCAGSCSADGRSWEDGMPEVTVVRQRIHEAACWFLWTADGRYMDFIERSSFNYLLSITDEHQPLSFDKHVAAQTLMDVSGMIYATDDEGVYVNLYLNNSTHIKTQKLNLVVDQITALPNEPRLKIRISGLAKGRTPFTIRFRIPDWALRQSNAWMPYRYADSPLPLPTIYINGRDERLTMENGYIVVQRLWNNGDEIYLDFPFDFVVLHENTPQGNFGVLQRGPLVYGTTELPEFLCLPHKLQVEEGWPNIYGHSVFSVKLHEKAASLRAVEFSPIMDGSQFCRIPLCEGRPPSGASSHE